MTLKKIAELRQRIEELRGQAQVPSRVLENLAKALAVRCEKKAAVIQYLRCLVGDRCLFRIIRDQ